MNNANKLHAMPHYTDMLSSRVISIPIGGVFYRDGTQACHHVAEFTYPDCVRSCDQKRAGENYNWRAVSTSPTSPTL